MGDITKSQYSSQIFMCIYFRDELREHLKNAPKMIMSQQRPGESDSDSDSSDDNDSEGSWESFLWVSSYDFSTFFV